MSTSDLGLKARIESLDVLRGLVMIIMALDHTREYLYAAAPNFDPTDPAQTTLILFATRWITHLCAPTFVLLTGVSAWLRRDSAGVKSVSGFLATRGLWLLFMELTVVATGFTFHPGYLFLQVIWVIGAGMILLAALTPLRASIVLGLGLAIIAGHNLLDPVDPKSLGGWAEAFNFLHGRFAFIRFGPFGGVLLYSLLGWAGILFAGYGLGPVFRMERARRDRILTTAGLAAIAGFLALRGFNHYGDPLPWSRQGAVARTVMAFLDVSKYPPSLDFDLITLGPVLLLLPWLERWRGKLMQVFRTYGRVPFFYYVLHIYLIHGLAVAAGMTQGLPFSAFTDPLKTPPPGFGFSLPVTYLLWLAVVGALYPLCRWFEGVRQRRRDWWLSYL